MDENNFGHNTRTYAFDVADLDAPVFLGYYEHATTARDHNVYIVGNYAYETNWRAGLRILDISSLPSTDFTEVAYFDVDPTSDSIAMTGSWSNYPWWTDGTVTVSDTEQGLFILQPQLAPTDVSLIGLDGQVATPAGAWLAALLTATLLLAVAIWYLRRRSHA
jgi:choice-of-anchor B domain-containing protein